MFFALIFGLLAGTLTTEQLHYNECQRSGFDQPACRFEKKLDGLKR